MHFFRLASCHVNCLCKKPLLHDASEIGFHTLEHHFRQQCHLRLKTDSAAAPQPSIAPKCKRDACLTTVLCNEHQWCLLQALHANFRVVQRTAKQYLWLLLLFLRGSTLACFNVALLLLQRDQCLLTVLQQHTKLPRWSYQAAAAAATTAAVFAASLPSLQPMVDVTDATAQEVKTYVNKLVSTGFSV